MKSEANDSSCNDKQRIWTTRNNYNMSRVTARLTGNMQQQQPVEFSIWLVLWKTVLRLKLRRRRSSTSRSTLIWRACDCVTDDAMQDKEKNVKNPNHGITAAAAENTWSVCFWSHKKKLLRNYLLQSQRQISSNSRNNSSRSNRSNGGFFCGRKTCLSMYTRARARVCVVSAAAAQ